jgi:SAM-dependent methyltransferase
MGLTAALQRQADDTSQVSLSHRMRARRFERFEQLTAQLPRPLSILDVGGTNAYWAQRGWTDRGDVTITTVNLVAQEREHENVTPMQADATALPFEDGSFDLVFSNSVIEHLFTLENQRRMAHEVRRVGRAYWVQTPNFWFPVEPHFLAPAWHWLPVGARVAVLQRRAVGWNGRCPDVEKARAVVTEHRLMRRSELSRLFPDARIESERVGGLVKSFTAVRGL